jgi:hypothetical protein
VLASTSRPDRVFCSATCRSAAYRPRQAAESLAPAELARLADALPPAVAEAALVAGITQAARVDWRAGAWLLERRWPERWAELERATEPRVPGKASSTGRRTQRDATSGRFEQTVERPRAEALIASALHHPTTSAYARRLTVHLGVNPEDGLAPSGWRLGIITAISQTARVLSEATQAGRSCLLPRFIRGARFHSKGW